MKIKPPSYLMHSSVEVFLWLCSLCKTSAAYITYFIKHTVCKQCTLRGGRPCLILSVRRYTYSWFSVFTLRVLHLHLVLACFSGPRWDILPFKSLQVCGVCFNNMHCECEVFQAHMWVISSTSGCYKLLCKNEYRMRRLKKIL